MFIRHSLLKTIGQNLFKARSYQRCSSTIFVRKVSTENSLDFKLKSIGIGQSEDVFLDLTMEYNRRRSVRSELISAAIRKIDQSIPERLSLLMLTAAARCVHNLTPEKRVELLEETWKTFSEKNVRLTTRHYETYLSGLNENGFIFDADYYLKLIDKEQIQATPRIYSLLLTQYCREGNTDRAQSFLKMLKERNVSIDEDIFAALIVCQLKLGNEKGANDIIQIMKERGLQPTISTYKEILTALISEHKFEQFENYFGQIEFQQGQNAAKSSSTVYVDASFVLMLLGQCVSHKERSIFDFLLNKLKNLDYKRMPNNIFNLSIQCLANEWNESIVDLLQMEIDQEISEDKPSPYQAIHGRQWTLFFKHLYENDQWNLVENYLDLMMEKNLIPLDSILRVFYSSSTDDFRPALNLIERAQEKRHPMRTNYFYPLLTNAFSSETSNKWTEDDRLKMFRLLDRLAIPIESSTYSRLIQKSFHNFYKENFRNLFESLSKNGLNSILDRISRLLLNDIQSGSASLKLVEQIVPFFRLNRASRQEELGKFFFSLIVNSLSNSPNRKNRSEFETNFEEIFQTIDQISKSTSKENPRLKRDLFVEFFRLSAENRRKDLTEKFAQKCLEENLQLSGSINEIDSLTGFVLSREILEKLTRYKRGEISWKEKLRSIDLSKANRKQIEQIYEEAKEDGQIPIEVQQKLLEIYCQNKTIDKALKILREIFENRGKINSSILRRLIDLTTNNFKETNQTKKSTNFHDLQFLREIYEKLFNLIDLPSDLTMRLVRADLLNGNEEKAMEILSEKINKNFNEKVYEDLLKFLQTDSSLLSNEGLMKIGRLFIAFRMSEPIRKFWQIFFDLLLQKTSSQDLVQFYSDAMRENSNVPYNHLFEIFIERDELNYLQDIVDIATLQHGSNNVLHDLGFALIKAGKIQHAEKIFKTSWLKARNDRINLNALLLSDSNDIDSLINAIKLTKDIPDVNQQPLFSAAIRVAVRLERSDTIDWLIQEVRERHIQLEPRLKKFIDAHLLSKGLDPLNIVEYNDEPLEISNNTESNKQKRHMSAQS